MNRLKSINIRIKHILLIPLTAALCPCGSQNLPPEHLPDGPEAVQAQLP